MLQQDMGECNISTRLSRTEDETTWSCDQQLSVRKIPGEWAMISPGTYHIHSCGTCTRFSGASVSSKLSRGLWSLFATGGLDCVDCGEQQSPDERGERRGKLARNRISGSHGIGMVWWRARTTGSPIRVPNTRDCLDCSATVWDRFSRPD